MESVERSTFPALNASLYFEKISKYQHSRSHKRLPLGDAVVSGENKRDDWSSRHVRH